MRRRTRTELLAVACIAFAAPACGAAGMAGPRAPARTHTRLVMHGDAIWPPGARPAPNFVLRNSRGGWTSLRSQRGKVVVLTFLDSHCRTLCPIEGSQLGRLAPRLGPTSGWRLLVVSVNPRGRDTSASVARFAAHSRWPASTWTWLTGPLKGLRRVWRRYGIEVTSSDAHSSAIYVIDQHGDERTGYAYPTVAMPQLVRDIRALERRG